MALDLVSKSIIKVIASDSFKMGRLEPPNLPPSWSRHYPGVLLYGYGYYTTVQEVANSTFGSWC